MWLLYVLGGIVFLLLFGALKETVWDKPHEEIDRLKRDITKLQSLHKDEILRLENRLNNNSSLHIQSNEFSDIVVSSAWKELSELCNKEFAFLGIPQSYSYIIGDKERIAEPVKRRFREAIDGQYKYQYLVYLYPELAKVFNGPNVASGVSVQPTNIALRSENLFEIVNLLRRNQRVAD